MANTIRKCFVWLITSIQTDIWTCNSPSLAAAVRSAPGCWAAVPRSQPSTQQILLVESTEMSSNQGAMLKGCTCAPAVCLVCNMASVDGSSSGIGFKYTEYPNFAFLAWGKCAEDEPFVLVTTIPPGSASSQSESEKSRYNRDFELQAKSRCTSSSLIPSCSTALN